MAIDTYWSTCWTRAVSEPDAEARRSEETAWIAASRRGDRAAFEALVKRHEQRVFRLARRFFRRPEEVEDVAQETFLTVWRKLATYSARAPFEHWLTRVCLNCCYARFRKRRPEETGVDGLDAPERPHDPTLRVDAERLLSTLEPEDRFVLQLLHGEGWTTGEIAERMGWTRSRVKVRAHRARVRLRKALLAGGSR